MTIDDALSDASFFTRELFMNHKLSRLLWMRIMQGLFKAIMFYEEHEFGGSCGEFMLAYNILDTFEGILVNVSPPKLNTNLPPGISKYVASFLPRTLEESEALKILHMFFYKDPKFDIAVTDVKFWTWVHTGELFAI